MAYHIPLNVEWKKLPRDADPDLIVAFLFFLVILMLCVMNGGIGRLK